MNQFTFWRKWLFGLGMFMVVFGIATAFLNQTELFDILFNNQINSIFFPEGGTPPQISAFQQWVYGVLGATVIGWGVFIVFIVYYPFRNRERWVWYCLAVGVTCWFIIDTAISVYFMVFFNAAFNILLFILVVLPLIFTWRYFRENGKGV